MKKGKKTFSVVGNCQAPYVAHALLSSAQFNDQYSWVRTPPVHLIPREEISTQFENLKNVDVIIHQPIVDTKRFGEFETEHLREVLSPNHQLVCIPSWYFNGYFPTISTISGLTTPAGAVHDMAVFHAFDLGLSVEETTNILYETNFAPPGFYKERWEAGMKSLKEREVKFDVDTPVSSFLDKVGREEILMHQHNHPTKASFDFLSSQIGEVMGVEGEEYRTGKDLNNLIWPVFPWVQDDLGIRDENTERNFIILKGEVIEFKDFVSGSFSSYERMTHNQREICAKRTPDVRSYIQEKVN
ncbi:hypothetical protein HJ526_17265 [Donghicola sp. C2-DW-16]|uniref:Polysaccharide biosynthesis enzyme WcbI domain-containing protein n=1 Tax=Donghicola mangrovi TaxID=2729614 RepID=A0ABX2PKE4_9RHOB|nr:WcbI family polysaccharide biosynthesis putative acetyltransferase [Donghicola mangrovi]NVO29177.1 hypothetical protein [Donghicola mangrovi]